MNRRIQKECENSCEYLLPDYMGDIRKVLMSRARVIPGGKFVSDGAVEVSGTVEYEVTYADSENKLTVVSADSDFEVKLPVDTDGECEVYEDSEILSLSLRVAGPRKLALRSALRTEITLSESGVPSVEGDVFEDGEEVESESRVICAEYSRFAESDEHEYAEEAERLVGVRSEDVEILSVSGSVRVIESQSVDGGVRVKGEIIIVALIRTPEQPVIAIRRAIPFEETVTVDGAASGMDAIADGYVSSAVCGVNADGEDAVVVVNAIAKYRASVLGNEDVEVITDAYLCRNETENKYTRLEYKTLLSCENFDSTLSFSLPKESLGCMDAAEIITMNAEVRSAQLERRDSGVVLHGEILISGVACENNVDGTKTYIPIKTQQTFEQNVNINCQIADNSVLECRIFSPLCEALFDAENIHVKAVLCGRILHEASNECTRLSECQCGRELSSFASPSRITVYYPTGEDTLFSVAKKFHTTVAKIAADNKIDESAMQGGDYALSCERIILR